MSQTAMYMYPWDLLEEGVAPAVDRLRRLGINTVTMAGSYHAGKFLRPKGTAGKVYFPQDGTAYFQTDPSRYGSIRPVRNYLMREGDPLRELTETPGITVNAWMVLLHNALLGNDHPDSTVHNVFGDSYIYSLCPSAPDARAYAVGLATDLTESYPVSGIAIESPGFLPYAHGFHHEMSFVRPNAWLSALLGLCFCRHCLHGADSEGIDAQRLRSEVAGDIDDYLSSETDLPSDMAEAFWLADVQANAELRRYLDYRCSVVTSLVGEIRAAVRDDAMVAIIPSVDRPTAGAWYEGSDLAALAGVTGLIEACFYESSVDRIHAELFDVKRRMKGAGRIRGILRPAYPDLDSREAVIDAYAALVAGGVHDVGFYAYGHVRSRSLGWIRDAIAAAGGGYGS